MAPVEDVDSGMESQDASQVSTSKDFSPDKKLELEGNYEDEPDETLAERLWGLTEMFPESLRNFTYKATKSAESGAKNAYSFSRNATWILFTTSLILFAPIVFEIERSQLEEMQRNQQKQMLLGPNTGVSGGGMPMMPPMQR